MINLSIEKNSRYYCFLRKLIPGEKYKSFYSFLSSIQDNPNGGDIEGLIEISQPQHFMVVLSKARDIFGKTFNNNILFFTVNVNEEVNMVNIEEVV